MTSKSALLYAYGFKRGEPKIGNISIKIEGNTPDQKLRSIRELEAKYKSEGKLNEFNTALEGAADHDWQELTKEQIQLVDYPRPLTRFVCVVEKPNQSIEPVYYFLIDTLEAFGFSTFDKVTDIFTAAEHSSLYGASAQRLGLAQDKVAQYMASMGKLVKDLFQMVREVRWIDERLRYYRNSMGEGLLTEEETKKDVKLPEKEKDSRKYAAEVALKGMWVDLVDGVIGGQRTGSNILTMAQQLQFVTLPDLFFSIHPKSKELVGPTVDKEAGEFNEMVKNALKRKLYAYMAWKETTYDELKNRRKFTLNYLRQHFGIIRMYMNWVKPYLKHIEKLQSEPEKAGSAQLISSFEGSLVDIEVIGRYMIPGNKKVFSCVMLTLEFRTRPQMQYAAEGGYHRGPIHVGVAKIYWRSYTWSEQEIQNYIAMRNREDFELLGTINKGLKDAMEALGEDFDRYLKEAGAGMYDVPPTEIKPPEKKKEQKMDFLGPIKEVFKGGKELLGAIKESVNIAPNYKVAAGNVIKGEKKSAEKMAKFWTWMLYKLFKKSEGLPTW